jgi:hypothetical protein
MGVMFLDGGQEKEIEESVSSPRVFSFSKDASLIFAAFKQTHGIDLQTAQLHWWKFLALFMDLGQDTTFCQLTALRKRVKTGKATKEEIRVAQEMGQLFELPDVEDLTLEERDNGDGFMKLLGEG